MGYLDGDDVDRSLRETHAQLAWTAFFSTLAASLGLGWWMGLVAAIGWYFALKNNREYGGGYRRGS